MIVAKEGQGSARKKQNTCEEFETIGSCPFLCGLEELIPPSQVYPSIYYDWLHSLSPATLYW